jgi:hypothetical protein
MDGHYKHDHLCPWCLQCLPVQQLACCDKNKQLKQQVINNLLSIMGASVEKV